MKAIFIGGCERSGTTLLGAMLGASLAAVCTPESQFKTEILEQGGADRGLGSSQFALAAIARHWRFAAWGLAQRDIRRLSGKRCANYAELLEDLVLRYAENIGKGGRSARSRLFWVDHTPSNILHLDRLFSIFPDAVCVHIVRDGRAVAASVMPLDWGPNTAFFAGRWWARQISLALAAESHFGPEKMLRVHYEDLLSAPGDELQRICRFAGIEYVDAMRTACGFRLPPYTAAQHSRLQIGRIDKNRAYGWRNALTRKQIGLFEYATGDLLAYLGYRMDSTWPAAPTPAALTATGLEEAWRWTTNRVRRWFRKRRHLRT